MTHVWTRVPGYDVTTEPRWGKRRLIRLRFACRCGAWGESEVFSPDAIVAAQPVLGRDFRLPWQDEVRCGEPT